MGEDVVETWWKHWKTLGKYGETTASQYRLQTHVWAWNTAFHWCPCSRRILPGSVGVLESLSVCKARVRLDGSEKPVSLDQKNATCHLPVFWMVRIWQVKPNGWYRWYMWAPLSQWTPPSVLKELHTLGKIGFSVHVCFPVACTRPLLIVKLGHAQPLIPKCLRQEYKQEWAFSYPVFRLYTWKYYLHVFPI